MDMHLIFLSIEMEETNWQQQKIILRDKRWGQHRACLVPPEKQRSPVVCVSTSTPAKDPACPISLRVKIGYGIHQNTKSCVQLGPSTCPKQTSPLKKKKNRDRLSERTFLWLTLPRIRRERPYVLLRVTLHGLGIRNTKLWELISELGTRSW